MKTFFSEESATLVVLFGVLIERSRTYRLYNALVVLVFLLLSNVWSFRTCIIIFITILLKEKILCFRLSISFLWFVARSLRR